MKFSREAALALVAELALSDERRTNAALSPRSRAACISGGQKVDYPPANGSEADGLGAKQSFGAAARHTRGPDFSGQRS